MNRRGLLRALGAAPMVAAAPAMIDVPAKSGMLGYAGGVAGGVNGIGPDYQAQRIAELRNRIAGRQHERDERYYGKPNQTDRTLAVEALRSVSAVNKCRMIREREAIIDREAMAWWASWELFDLIGSRK